MIEFSPFFMDRQLKKYMIRHRMVIISENLLDDGLRKNELIKSLAKKYAKTPSQILLKWAAQSGIVALPSRIDKKQSIAEYGQAFGFELEYNDIDKMNKLNRQKPVSDTDSQR